MAIPDRPRSACSDPRYVVLQTDDGSYTLEEVATGNTFHSGCGAVAECLEVYARNSGVWDLLKLQQRAKVLEVGFGTGLAFLATASLATRFDGELDYVSYERTPLAAELFNEFLSLSQQVADIDPSVAVQLKQHLAKFESEGWQNQQTMLLESGRIRLMICVADILSVDIACNGLVPQGSFDAIYFDPFDPLSNPEAWSPSTYAAMYNALRPEGRLTSYCVKSIVRRELAEVGFEIERVPGPVGGKREVLVARKPKNGNLNSA